ncbi:MAG: hypothetical protein NXI20_00595 [bacterium]|nr:hypothetical protein [bacterium]
MKNHYFAFLFSLCFVVSSIAYSQENYLDYHRKVTNCEQLITQEKYGAALTCLDSIFSEFDFIFLREIKLATELSIFQNDYLAAFKYLRIGISNGWSIKRIKSSKSLQILQEEPEWFELESNYDSLIQIYKNRINTDVRNQVRQMVKKDQKMAIGAFIRIREKSQNKYTRNKFAPHSERQMSRFQDILEKHGYPGEKIAGHNLWASIIVCHHNSISPDYNSKDTLYTSMRPWVLKALEKGEISPYEFAQMEDWKTAVLNDHKRSSFGFIGDVGSEENLMEINQNRSAVGMRSTHLRNQLLDIEKSTGLNLYLPKGWREGVIDYQK